ncbi:hypothetical protein ACFL5O_05140, partial [Myxococcota bacterium]
MKENSRTWSAGVFVLAALTVACGSAADSSLPHPATGTGLGGSSGTFAAQPRDASNLDKGMDGAWHGGAGSVLQGQAGGGSPGRASNEGAALGSGGLSMGDGGPGVESSGVSSFGRSGASTAAGGPSTAARGAEAAIGGVFARTGGASGEAGGVGGAFTATGGL